METAIVNANKDNKASEPKANTRKKSSKPVDMVVEICNIRTNKGYKAKGWFKRINRHESLVQLSVAFSSRDNGKIGNLIKSAEIGDNWLIILETGDAWRCFFLDFEFELLVNPTMCFYTLFFHRKIGTKVLHGVSSAAEIRPRWVKSDLDDES